MLLWGKKGQNKPIDLFVSLLLMFVNGGDGCYFQVEETDGVDQY